MSEPRRPRPSLSTQVLIGLVFGVAVGVFFGDTAAVLGGVGRAFILLLQMPVLPFVVVSLVLGLGRLDAKRALAVVRGGGLVLLAQWALVMAVVLVFPLSFPSWESASFFSPALVETPQAIDFLGLYIPANPFASLAGAVVPAIVVFSVATGVALIGVERKDTLLEVLSTVQTAIERITGGVVRLAPLGVFALMANAAGTLDVSELGRIQVYVLVYVVSALVLCFWALPALVTTLTPLRYAEVVGPVRDALVTAFATGNLLIVLPLLAREAREILERAGLEAESADASVDVLVPASFTLPNMGKLLSLAFVPFAGWFTGFGLAPDQVPLFAAAGFVSFFGEPVVSLPFLLDLLRIPADTFELFVTVDVLTGRFGTLLAACHTLVLALLGAFVMSGRVELALPRIGVFLAVTGVLVIGAIGGARLLFTYGIEPSYTKYHEFMEIELLNEPVAVSLVEEPSAGVPGPPAAGRRLAHVRERGALRVGYFADALPFAFRNARGDVVGFDIEMAHLLARDLGVRLELVRIPREQAASALHRGLCDVLMSGSAITPERAARVHFSPPVMELTLAFVVRDHERHGFSSWESMRQREDLSVGIGRARHYERLLQRLLPEARIVEVGSPRDFFRNREDPPDALALPAESGTAWTLVYPHFAVAVPQPDPIAVPMAYATPAGEAELGAYLDAFVRLRRTDGTVDTLFAHWFEGRRPAEATRRWSLARDVLGWMD